MHKPECMRQHPSKEGPEKHNSWVQSWFAFDPYRIWGSREKHRNWFGFYELGVENWGVLTNEIEESTLEVEGFFFILVVLLML